jgi:hypothetical protein
MADDTFTWQLPDGQADERCSFCGKAAREVDRLIYAQRSPGEARAVICNKCVSCYHAWLTPIRT